MSPTDHATETETETGLTLSDAAVAQIRSIMEKESLANHVLRVSVVGGGCSGFSYRMGFVEEPNANDQLVEREGVRLVVDPKSMLYLQGTMIDFSDGIQGKGFSFVNPNAKKTCGCGSSFSG
jgi:iron-sulfur cluster assembly protein